MKPIEFIPTAGPCGKYMSFGTNGQIVFSSEARTFLSLKDGDTAKMFRDQENEKMWYLSLQNGGGYPIKSKNEGKSLYFQNSGIVRAVRSTFPFKKGGSARLHVGDPKSHDGETYYPLTHKD